MSKIIITVGCPGAGKSTWAANLPTGTLRLERDMFRELLWGSRQSYHADQMEHKNRVIVSAMVAAARAWPMDRPIALTDTGIHWSAVAPFAPLRSEPEIVVFDVPLDVLIERNKTRDEAHRVPEQVIRDFHTAMHAPDAWWRQYPHRQAQD